jgi:hypothetical protein
MRPPAPRALAVLVPVFACLSGAAALKGTAPPRFPAPSPRQLLCTAALLSPVQATKVEQGEVVVRMLGAAASHEVAVSGAVRIASPKEAYMELAASPPRLKRGPAILQLGVFGPSPCLLDVASLTLDDTELAALRRCESGDCSSKLSALDIDAFRRFDWPAQGAKSRAEALVRAGLAAHVRDYVTRGNAAMMRFTRTRFPTSLETEFRSVLTASSHATNVAPELAAFLELYKEQPIPPGATEAWYWARETFGLKPVLSAYHVVVYRPPARPDLGLVVSKQFYASRYFDVSLEISIVADEPAPGGPEGCYLVYVARSRVDSLRGRMAGLKRGTVERESLEATTARLAGLRTQLTRFTGTSRPSAPGRE